MRSNVSQEPEVGGGVLTNRDDLANIDVLAGALLSELVLRVLATRHECANVDVGAAPGANECSATGGAGVNFVNLDSGLKVLEFVGIEKIDEPNFVD